MDQLHLMQAFVTVADERGFAAAARRLNLSPPAVTRAIAMLEARLGVKLLNRSTRYVRVTEAGQRYLEDVRRILQEVALANEAVVGINAEPRGKLAVTAPILFGQQYVMPGIVDYLRRFPETQVEAVFLDRVVNLLEEGLDVGIRIGKLPDSSLNAVPVGTVRQMLVAAPDYLAREGQPTCPDDLAGHTLIASSAGSMGHDWHLAGQNGPVNVRIQPRLMVTTLQAAINAAVAGLGIARVISYQVTEQLDNASLAAVLESFQPPPMPVHIVYREGRMASAKVRCFVDLMSHYLRNHPALC